MRNYIGSVHHMPRLVSWSSSAWDGAPAKEELSEGSRCCVAHVSGTSLVSSGAIPRQAASLRVMRFI